MSGKRVARAAGALGLALLLVGGQAVAASAAADAPPYRPSDDIRSSCDVTTWSGVTYPVNASFYCRYIPSGVQVRIVIDTPGVFDAYSAWMDYRNIGQHLGARTDIIGESFVRLEERVDPDLPGTDCTSKILKKDRFLQYDAHAAEITCTSIADGIKVRARADFDLQPDEVSAWLTAPGSAVSPYKVRKELNMPRAAIDYEIR